MVTTTDIIALINALCLCADCHINIRLSVSAERPVCCKMNRISKDMIFKGVY